MSRFEAEEEDELQMILEGRDVEDYRDYNYRTEDHLSDQSNSNRDYRSDEDSDHQTNQSFNSKKRGFDDHFNPRREKSKQKTISVKNQLNKEFENDFRDEQNLKEVANNEINENVVKVKVKVRRTLKPQPKLNAERLTADEGVVLLPQLFSDFKFGPKGSELKDLNAMLFRFSHWSHRLFPGLTFDDFIEKCEQLGNKRQVKNFVTQIRNDLPLNSKPNETQLEEEDQQNQDFNDKDFDYIIANTYGNITENTDDNQKSDSHFEDLSVGNNQNQNQSLAIDGTQLSNNYINDKDLSEFNDKSTNLEKNKQINDSDDEELSEEQLLREINEEEDQTNE